MLLGADIGTTAVKCVAVRAASDDALRYQVLASSYVALADVALPPQLVHVHGEQHVEQVLRAVHRAIIALPLTNRERVTSIGICGQVRVDCLALVRDHVQRLLASEPTTEWRLQHKPPAWSKLVTWQDQRCSPAFLQQCNERIERALVGSTSSSSSPLATGYGLATYAHTLAHAPATLSGFDACGTIQDLVAFAFCGHNSREAVAMDTTNACSWGGFDVASGTWNGAAISALGIPLAMLPVVKQPGDTIGCIPSSSAFGLPPQATVFVPIGDHPSSVVAALAPVRALVDANVTLVNIGTSAQLAMLLSADDAAAAAASSTQSTSSFEIRPFVLQGQQLGVAASLSGGDIFAWFVAQCQDWMRELGAAGASSGQGSAHWYARLIELGLAKTNTALVFRPTLSGERSDPSARGAIANLSLSNGSLGDMSAALCRGLIDNLFDMVPPALQAAVMTRATIGTGSALERNALLRHFLAAKLADASRQLQIQSAADAALGAALTPLLVHTRRDACG